MAGRTLQQAMAYLGLAEQHEPVSESRRRAHDDYRESDYEHDDDFFDEKQVAYDTQPVSEEHFLSQFEDEDEPETLAPIIETKRNKPARSVASSAVSEFFADSSRGTDSETRPAQPAQSSARFSDANESEDELRRITTIHPRSYNDAKIIGESFRENIPVIMNVTDMGESEAKRLVDFSAGLAFALHGSIERVTDKVFLLTPANLEVLGAEGAEVPVALDSDSSDLFNQG